MSDGRDAPKQALTETLIQAIGSALQDDPLPGENDDFDNDRCLGAARLLAQTGADRTPGTALVHIEPLEPRGARRRMAIAIVNDDMPFLVDSVANIFAAHGLVVDRVLHPVLRVRREGNGRLAEILPNGTSGARRESFLYLETERASAKLRKELQTEIEATLADVRAAVRDWNAMQDRLRADADRLGDGEGAALLRWFLDRNLTQLGAEVRTRDGTRSDLLGVATSDERPLLHEQSMALAFKWFDQGKRAPLILKSNSISRVHRHVPIDLFVVPIHGADGVEALSIHAGLWTSAALAAPPEKVPLLRRRLTEMMEKHGFDAAGHAGKALAHALTALPHDLLIAFDASDLERVTLTSMSLADRPRAKMSLIRSPLGRHLFCFVWLPRDELSTGRREAIGAMLVRAAHASPLGWSIALEEGGVALIRYTLDLRDGGVVPDEADLDRRLERMVRGWAPAVESALVEAGEESRAAALGKRYANAFPPNYRASYGPVEAARDILRLHAVAPHQRGCRLYRLDSDDENCLRLKVYQNGGSIPLSDAVPALENFGFRVIDEVPTPMKGDDAATIHDFLLRLNTPVPIDTVLDRATVVEEAITAVLSGHSENDGFNQLILSAGLDPLPIVWLRAWFRYLRQTGLSYGVATVVAALRNAPAVTRGLITLFCVRHDPNASGGKPAIKEAEAAIEAALADVSAIDDDRILRLFRSVILATLRTNAFAPAAQEAIAFKLDSAGIPGLPAPLPWREIFVYSPRVEGIHLRAGPVARGGLRWSDRRDDFRTEILGLMKAQRVKNAVIVPTGAKGGFFPKMLPDPQADRDAWLAEGTESYRIFIRTLLSVTDNIVEGKVVHPKGVVIHDGDDPYFVVAADKGTATFSDIANEIAIGRGFWLGDAFASGGSHGYDHKAMGITARGAWISVQRHFSEMGIDIQSEPVRVVGCGDMSGDVFGNGMLLSKSVKLIAAFDHRHIFIDPDPDPARSWNERQRLFDKPRSSWADYDEALISKGGGVFPRSQKSIMLSEDAAAALGIEAGEVDPGSLISAILKSPNDLLWFGGIGTYVKARSESHVDVGDPANDRIRVNAGDLRVKVVGEGANLGVTQAGRIDFALQGGRINTDFIDNSAGVDCSDNEVNIKIALNREMNEDRLAFEDRNSFLAEMTGEVADIVLEDNRLQALALSIAEKGGPVDLPSYVRLIEIFETSGRLDRRVEGLEANDVLLRRSTDGRGLTRPELAVLLSTAKLALQDAIEKAPLVADPAMDGELQAAFPEAMQNRFGEAIAHHQLRGQIIATELANRIVNRLGLIHPFELAEEEGCSLGAYATGHVIVERLFGIDRIWADIDTTEMPESGRLALFGEIATAVRGQVADLLRTLPRDIGVGEALARLEQGVSQLEERVDVLLPHEAGRRAQAIADMLERAGAPAELAARVVRLHKLDGAIGIADLSAELGMDETLVTECFTRLGEALGLDWAQSAAARMDPSDPWERLLVSGIARDLQQMRLEFLARQGGAGESLRGRMVEWLEQQDARVRQFRTLVDRARRAAAPTTAMLAQIAGQGRLLLGR